MVKVVHYIVLISCCELTVFCITDLSLELFSNVLKAGFLIMWLFKVRGGVILCTYNVPEDCNMIGCFQELRYGT